MSRLYRLLKPLLFLLDAETAHRLVGVALRPWSVLSRFRRAPSFPALRLKLWGLEFDNPIGLAAGMDKGQVLVPGWFALGFGFVEVGTITPRPQPGNPAPRLFRLVGHRAVINRMGFNNAGMEQVARRLAALGSRRGGPVIVNLGRNKDTPNERAAEDYATAFRVLAPHADLAEINVSSPNTPGLRALQGELGALVAAVSFERDRLERSSGRRVPLLVKLSPDEPPERLVEMATTALDAGADGIVATNTTLDRSRVADDPAAGETGGLSGAPLREVAQLACARLWVAVGARAPIVGVGGISSAADAYARLRAGASLIEVYTALVYEGPGLPRALSEGLCALLRRDGLTLDEAIGRDAAALVAAAGAQT